MGGSSDERRDSQICGYPTNSGDLLTFSLDHLCYQPWLCLLSACFMLAL